MQKTIIAISIILVLAGVGVYIFKNPNIHYPLVGVKQTNPDIAVDPFVDMTIPYLRQKEYKSNLGQLEFITESDDYSSYVTSYKSEGLKINGLLTKPIGEQPSGGWPGIVFIHGYIPPRQYQTTEKYAGYVDYLARNGFVVFKIDLRGHGNSEGMPGGAYYSADYVIDALNAYSALQNSGLVDPKKIGLWGHSMAGNITIRSIAAKPDIPAAVIWGGAGFTYTDLIKYGISDASYQPQPLTSNNMRRQKMVALHGQPNPENPFWREVIPTNYLNDFKGSIELHHAIDDQTVNIEYSRELNKILDQTKVPHQLFEYSSGGHNISGENFNLAIERTVQFFKDKFK
jgi:uncharacterized protein